ncbi:MAG TPA: hypothetical protein VGC89_05595 [Pyrinomonadaceae bacterium]
MLDQLKNWWRQQGRKLAYALAIMAAIFAPYLPAVKRACGEFWGMVAEDFPIPQIITALVLLFVWVFAYPIYSRVYKKNRGSLTQNEWGSLILGVLGILAAFLSKEARDQVMRVAPVLLGNFPEPHLLLVLYLFIAWGAITPVLKKRRLRNRPTFDVHASVVRATDKMRDHVERAAVDALGSAPSPLATKLAASVIDTYGQASSNLAQYETRDLMLMGNFSIYAQCVKGMLDCVSATPKIKEACIYTLLRRPLIHWYNPLAKYLPLEGDMGNGVFTRPWWESYKARVAGLSSKQKGVRFSMKRLILQQRETDAAAQDGVPHLYVYTDGVEKNHRDGLPLRDLPPFSRDADDKPQFPHMSLLPEINRMAAATQDVWPKDARLHLIGRWDASQAPRGQKPSRRKWTPLVEHFQDAYHTKSVKAELTHKGKQDGIFYGYIKKLQADFRDYAYMYEDIFLIKIKKDDREENDEYFGVAFIDEKTGDEVGIRFLVKNEVEGMVGAFEKQWGFRGGTVENFCYCEEVVT